MKLLPTQVQCYSGYKADEFPLWFMLKGAWVEVREVTDRWYQGEQHPEWPMADYFKVLAKDGQEHLLKHDRETDAWFLVNPQE